MRQRAAFREAFQEPAAHRAVLDDPAEGRLVFRGGLDARQRSGRQITRAVMHEERALMGGVQQLAPASVGDPDFADRGRLGFEISPSADRGQHLLRAIGDGGGAAIESCLGEIVDRFRLDQRGRMPAVDVAAASVMPTMPPPTITMSDGELRAAMS